VDEQEPLDATEARFLERLRPLCLALPEVVEEAAWTGTRWCVGGKNFAHLVAIEGGWPPAYAKAAGTDGPVCVLTFRTPEPEAQQQVGPPFFWPGWFPDLGGVVLSDATAWDEIAELVTESWRTLAPKRLRAQLDRPPG
jgi:hypothetical protein